MRSPLGKEGNPTFYNVHNGATLTKDNTLDGTLRDFTFLSLNYGTPYIFVFIF